MTVLNKSVIATVFYFFYASHASSEELWRFRYLKPSSGESKITSGSNISSKKLHTSGYSGNIVFPNGIGLGYSTERIAGNLSGVDYKFKNHILDLAYTIGRNLSFTLGAGRLVYGRAEKGFHGTSYVTESSSGETIFLNLGIPFIGGELLLGYRLINSEYKNFQSNISGQYIILEDSIKLLSSQLTTGFGLIF